MRSPNAYTLLEILIAVSLLAGLMTIALPSVVGSFQRTRHHQATTALVRMATQARQLAITTGQTWKLTYSLSQHRLQATPIHTPSDPSLTAESQTTEIDPSFQFRILSPVDHRPLSFIFVSPTACITPAIVEVLHYGQPVEHWKTDRLTGTLRRVAWQP